jgi:hypothetical protein
LVAPGGEFMLSSYDWENTLFPLIHWKYSTKLLHQNLHTNIIITIEIQLSNLVLLTFKTSKNSSKYFSCYECFLYITKLLFVMHIRQTSFWLSSVFFFCGKFSYLANLFWKWEFFWEKELCIWGFFMSLFNSFCIKKHPILIYIVRNIEGCLIKI